MGDVVELSEALERKAADRFRKQREEVKSKWRQAKQDYPYHAEVIESLAGVFGKHQAIAIKDERLIFKHGQFDPTKPGVLNPGNFKDMDYDWFNEVRVAHKRMC